MAKKGSKKKQKMKKAEKDDRYVCTICGCEIVCTSPSASPILCCNEIMCCY